MRNNIRLGAKISQAVFLFYEVFKVRESLRLQRPGIVGALVVLLAAIRHRLAMRGLYRTAPIDITSCRVLSPLVVEGVFV